MDPIRRYYERLRTASPRSVVGTEGLIEPPTTEAPKPAGDTPLSGFADWVWPLPEVHGNHPTVSDGFGVQKRFDEKTKAFKGHFGADIMWPRRRDDTGIKEVKGDDARGTVAKGHLIYADTPVVACGAGQVFNSKKTNTGTEVKISHVVDGRPILSVYRHLKNSLVTKGQIVKAGEPLGMPGDNPAANNDPPHLHFELWDTRQGSGYPQWNIDPMSVARPWKVLRLADGALVQYKGNFRFNPPSGSGTRVASILFFLGAGGLLVKLLKA